MHELADRDLPNSFRWLEPGVLQLDPRDPTFFQDPYPAYRAMHGHGATFHWSDLGCRAVAAMPAVSAILRDRRFGRILPDAEGRPDYDAMPANLANFYAVERHSLLDLEPPTHTRLRGLVLKAFTSRRVESLAPRIEALANGLIDRFAADGSAELVSDFATPLPVTVIAELIGVDASEAPRLLDWSHRMVAMYQFNRTRAVEDAADAAAGEFRQFVRDAIRAKRRRPADDLLSELVRAETEAGKLGEEEMISTVILLMNAGHEATVHQIGNGVTAILASRPRGPASLFATERTGAAAVEEALRFDTPLHLFRRIALGDLTLPDGTPVRGGEEVALLLAAANRDPVVFPEPDRFDAARTGPPPASFGAGIHFCVGAPLARLELRLALQTLFRRLPDLRLVEPPRYRDSWHFRGLERLAVGFEPVGVKA